MTDTDRIHRIECPWCHHTVGHYDICEDCGNPLPQSLQQMMYTKAITLSRSLEQMFSKHTQEMEPIPIEVGEEAQEVQWRARKRGVQAVDKLAPTDARPLKFITNGTGEVQEIAGSDHTRRLVLIANLGQPAIAGVPGLISAQPAIAASDCFIGFDNTSGVGDMYYLKAGNTFGPVDYAGKIYVTDAAIAVTVLSVVFFGIR